MSAPIVKVEGLGKQYEIQHQVDRAAYGTLRDAIAGALRSPWSRASRRRAALERFWALQDVSFDVAPGEAVGVIGRNGAGKSTLLKILSRITEPTAGRVTLRGRVASLLEVGTGFHPELTGRENVFLNGAILGMSKQETTGKFDAIVEFSGVERFLDTPVKRYSSGMYMRLAFAVAAHLDPEILVVDEVLAVGDAEFQKKCLGQMDTAAKSGRTLLFVSHNLGAMAAICSRGIVLKNGRVAFDGPMTEAIAAYGSDLPATNVERVWEAGTEPGDAHVTLHSIRIEQDNPGHVVRSGDPFSVVFDLTCHQIEPGFCVGFELFNQFGLSLFYSHHTDTAERDWPPVRLGRNRIACRMPAGWFNAGSYGLAPRISTHAKAWHVNLPTVLTFAVERTHGVSPFWTSLSDGFRPGQLAPILPWASLDA